MQVEVWSGDGKTYLGKGNYVGNVTIYYCLGNDDNIYSSFCAEEKPKGVPRNKIVSSKRNPKIILDSGVVVYGCQVWWKKVK